MRGLLVLFALASLPAMALADEPAQPKRRVIRLEEISVEGRIQKPQAFYILPRASLNYENVERHESFLPKITKPLERDPF